MAPSKATQLTLQLTFDLGILREDRVGRAIQQKLSPSKVHTLFQDRQTALQKCFHLCARGHVQRVPWQQYNKILQMFIHQEVGTLWRMREMKLLGSCQKQ